VLIITNGDSAAGAIRQAGVEAQLLPWRDVLHHGPVPAGLPLEELSDLRARYLSTCGWGGYDDIRRDFRSRDDTVTTAAGYSEVVLWFEHDLYDQLQLIQALTILAGTEGPPRVSLIDQSTFIAESSAAHLRGLFTTRAPVLDSHVVTARRAWHAFTAPTPEGWPELADEPLEQLPHLAAAFRRLLEELPAEDGLSRTERSALRCASERESITPPELFLGVQRGEDAAFMGDASFWLLLDRMAWGPAALLAGMEGLSFERGGARPPDEMLELPLQLTDLGSDVLEGRADWLDWGTIDRWLGGTHLRPGSVWRWQPDHGHLLAP